MSEELRKRYDKGFSYPNLRRMCSFYNEYKIFSTLSREFEKGEIAKTQPKKSKKKIGSILLSQSGDEIWPTLSAISDNQDTSQTSPAEYGADPISLTWTADKKTF